MGKKVIKVPLTVAGIDNALKELRDYQQWLEKKQKEFLDALAQEGLQVAESGFANAVYDGTNDVTCRIENLGDKKKAIVATGSKDPVTEADVVLFIEFGTGVTYADDHPEAAANGMIRGAFGHGLGRLENGWRYPEYKGAGSSGTPDPEHPGYLKTLGNPANKAMFNSKTELEERFTDIARRIFTR